MRTKISKKKNNKKLVRVISAVLVILLAAGFLGSDYLRSEASDRFPGVDTIISGKSSSKTNYTILEIVPDSGLGEIGYYVKGGEYNYFTGLMETAIKSDTALQGNNAAARENYFNNTIISTLINKGICAPANSDATAAAVYPISGSGYAEKYFLTSNDNASDWHAFSLPDFALDLTGSFMASSGNNTGNYDKSSEIGGFVASTGTGAYDVTFINNTDPTFDSAKITTDYAKYGSYQLDGSVYKKVSNTYVAGVGYYYVSAYTQNTALSGAYNALNTYTINSAGTGAYNFTEDSAGSLYIVPVNKSYYQTNIINNELFRKNVFGIADGEYTGFNIQVISYTESELESLDNANIPNFDMLYIAGDTWNSAAKTYRDYETGNPTTSLSYSRIMTLLNMIFATGNTNGNRSCIVNYSVFDKVNANAENVDSSFVYKLATILLQPDPETKYETLATDDANNSWTTLWNNVKTNAQGTATFYNYVNDNVYCFQNTGSIAACTYTDTKRGLVNSQLLNKFDTTSEADLISNGFQAILNLVDSENTIRSDSEQLKSFVSQARAIQYIINAWNPRQTELKQTINVLEIEPCADYTITDALVRTWASSLISEATSKGKTITINIDQMTTSEFIGKIDDLNVKYDLVYIGGNIGRMNQQVINGVNRTNYNDNSMDGLVYTHQGDYVYANASISGMLNRDYKLNSSSNLLYDNTQTSSTDNRLSYLASSSAYDKFATSYTSSLGTLTNIKTVTGTTSAHDVDNYRYSGNDITSFKEQELIDFVKARYAVVVDSSFFYDSSKTTVDASYIDNSSYMYQFLDEAKNYDNVMVANGATISNASKFSSYLNMNKPEISIGNHSEGTITDKQLTVQFTISSNVETDASTVYTPSFYVDLNADGRYSTLEEITDCIITDSNGDSVDKVDGKYILRSGQTYTLTKTLGSTYVGYIPYKLSIQEKSNLFIRTEYTNHCVIKAESDAKQEIRILQIMQDSGSGYKNNFNMSSDSTFQSLLKDKSITDNYTITIDTVTSNKYVADYNAYVKNGSDYLKNYNMLVLGFADVYHDISNTSVKDGALSPLGGILKFIKDGKSVLFTHDTTSFINTTSGKLPGVSDSDWGYNINSTLRSVVGMDRFGVTNSDNNELLDGDILKFNNSTTIASSGSFVKSVKQAASSNDNSSNDGNIKANDYSYVAGSLRNFASGETQGFTNSLLNMKKLFSNQLSSLKPTNTYPLVASNNNGSYPNSYMYAGQINSGQITQYPFNIENDSNEIRVATTHFQYYQLDLDADDDHDGMSDIVVWYTLSDVKNASGVHQNNIYTSSPNDVRNNYYIYSKGNVMYSGVGHSSVSNNKDSNAYEMKLYLNTIIAAYKNGAQKPDVTIRDNESITSASKANEYITYDQAIENNGQMDGDLTLYYEVEDSNLAATDRNITVQYFVEDSSGTTELYPDSGVKGKLIEGLTTTLASGSDAVSTLQSGNMYKVTIPKSLVALDSTQSTKKVYVVLTNNFQYYGESKTTYNYDELTIVRQQLFNLN